MQTLKFTVYRTRRTRFCRLGSYRPIVTRVLVQCKLSRVDRNSCSLKSVILSYQHYHSDTSSKGKGKISFSVKEIVFLVKAELALY